jgi:hypothetical protein
VAPFASWGTKAHTGTRRGKVAQKAKWVSELRISIWAYHTLANSVRSHISQGRIEENPCLCSINDRRIPRTGLLLYHHKRHKQTPCFAMSVVIRSVEEL